jgi:uncharacterized protein (TIGR02145 family)
MTDQDRNTYKTVTIDTQVWMAENLRTTRFSDNITIPQITDNAEWINADSPAYCWYDNDADANKSIYGALYNWHAVNTGRLCPTGWHVPSDEEWLTLRKYLGGEDFAGGKLKESGISHWQNPNEGATNESGFTALPGGGRLCVGIGNEGNFSGKGTICSWWSATKLNSEPSSPAYGYRINSNYPRLFHSGFYIRDGFNVRCIKD